MSGNNHKNFPSIGLAMGLYSCEDFNEYSQLKDRENNAKRI